MWTPIGLDSFIRKPGRVVVVALHDLHTCPKLSCYILLVNKVLNLDGELGCFEMGHKRVWIFKKAFSGDWPPPMFPRYVQFFRKCTKENLCNNFLVMYQEDFVQELLFGFSLEHQNFYRLIVYFQKGASWSAAARIMLFSWSIVSFLIYGKLEH